MNKSSFINPVPVSPILSAFLLLVLLALTACGGSAIALSGTITDAYTGNPVADAHVTIGRTRLTTNVDGQYTTSRWRISDTFEVNAPGYEPARLLLEEQPEIAQTEVQTITLNTTLRPNTLNGVVTSAYSGEPLANALVSIMLDGTDIITSTTTPAGQYTLNGVPEQFTLIVNAQGYNTYETELKQVTSYDPALRPNTLSGIVTDRYSDTPLGGVTVIADSATTTTEADGTYELTDIPPEVTEITFSAPGYATEIRQPGRSTQMNVTLRPDVLTAELVDKTTGKPIRNATIIATKTLPGTDVAFARIQNSDNGQFTLEGLPESGYVQVLSPGYHKAVLELKPGHIASRIELEPFYVRGLYITSAVSTSSSLVNTYLDIIDRTELNTIVIDLKSDLRDDLGLIYYDSQVPLVQELGTSADYMDIHGILAEAKRRGIYTIARVQVFSHDNALADARPDWAIKRRDTGEVFADRPATNIRYAWLDPWNRNVWDYNVQLSVEAALMGFDEINFDYIRYPDWYGSLEEYREVLQFSQPTDPKNDPQAMYENLANFMEYSHRIINGAGAFFSVDLFGRVMVAPSMPIGQNIALMADHADYICPMPYPSLWWPGYLGFDNPTAHPYEVIYESLKSSEKFFAGKYGRLRPWLQDHTDPWQGARVVTYGPAEVRAQIDAANDYGLESGKITGWTLYDSANTYTEAALMPAE